MKRTRTGSVVYMGQRTNKYARGTKGNPIVINQSRIPRALPMRPALYRKPDLKGMDTLYNPGTITNVLTSNADSFVLNLIQQGSGSWNRVGRSVRLKSVRIKGQAICNINLATTSAAFSEVLSNTLRMTVVWDKQPSGTLPTFNTIFGYTEQDGTEGVQMNSGLRYDNTGRFSVLLDKTIDGNSPASAGADVTSSSGFIQVRCSYDHYLKLGGRETIFSGQSAPMTIADISTGALYIIFRSKLESAVSGSDGSNWTLLDGQARLRYTD